MTLQAACFWSLAFLLVILLMGSIIDWLNRRRESDGKRIRDLVKENAMLRAQLRHQRFEGDWALDAAKTELALKNMMLRQKWTASTKGGR